MELCSTAQKIDRLPCRNLSIFRCLVLIKKMQARNHCAATVSENFTTYRNSGDILDSPKKSVQNIPANSFMRDKHFLAPLTPAPFYSAAAALEISCRLPDKTSHREIEQPHFS